MSQPISCCCDTCVQDRQACNLNVCLEQILKSEVGSGSAAIPFQPSEHFGIPTYRYIQRKLMSCPHYPFANCIQVPIYGSIYFISTQGAPSNFFPSPVMISSRLFIPHHIGSAIHPCWLFFLSSIVFIHSFLLALHLHCFYLYLH